MPLGNRPLKTIDNLFLDALPRDVIDELTTHVERVTLPFRAMVAAPDEVPSHVYFPIDCVLSIVGSTHLGGQIEVEAIGREGLFPLGTLIDRCTSAFQAICQVAGDAYRLPLDVCEQLAARHSLMRAQIAAYASASLDVRGQSIVCGGLHHTTERCARWILVTHDRVARDEFPLTHEVLALMLGVRRAGISLSAATLQNAGAIAYARGRITVVDRSRLERAACECYAAQNAHLERHGLRSPRLSQL